MWYSKYLQVFDRPVIEFPHTVKQDIANKINKANKRLETEKPLCSVVAIAHNEETHILVLIPGDSRPPIPVILGHPC